MEKQPFYFEIQDQLKMFLNALDGCIVRRYSNGGRVPMDQISVRYVYGPKQRALHDLTNKAQHITLPVVSYVIKSIQYDKSRVFNKIDGSHQFINGSFKQIPQPLPINITLDVAVITRFQTDMDQIISNMFSYFQDYIVISWNRMNLPYYELRSKCIWNHNAVLNYPVDIDESKPTRVEMSTSFNIEGWIFKLDDDPAGIIRNIEASFTAIDRISTNIIDLEAQRTTDNTESFVISGAPIIAGAYPYAINYETPYVVTIYGNFIRGITSAYLSSGSIYPESSSVLIDAFSSVPTLSADNPPFYGVEVDFDIINENAIQISIPPPLSGGVFDIITLNSVGYGSLIANTSAGVVVYDN